MPPLERVIRPIIMSVLAAAAVARGIDHGARSSQNRLIWPTREVGRNPTQIVSTFVDATRHHPTSQPLNHQLLPPVNYPSLLPNQFKLILAAIIDQFKRKTRFCQAFSDYMPTGAADATAAAMRWLERIEKGDPVHPERMAALMKTLKKPLAVFEAKYLKKPGFCLEHYGEPFVDSINEYFSKQANPGESSKIPVSNPTTTDRQNKEEVQKPSTSHEPYFREFFGPAMVHPEQHVQLLFPMRTLKVSPGKTEEPVFDLDPEFGEFVFKTREGEEQANVYPEGVSGFLAFEDVRAATHVANFVTKYTKKEVSVRHSFSRAFEIADKTCLFAFGLGFAAATRAAEARFHGKLFSVYCDTARRGNYWTDYFALRHIDSAENKNDIPVLKEIPLVKRRDVALIVRVLPEVESGETSITQPWFLLAGRTALGTVVAAHFIATQWRQLADLYITQNKSFELDSLAVVVSHAEAAATDQSLKSPFRVEKSARFYCWDETDDGEGTEKCIAWG
jgi:hypothetical protein